MMIQTENGVSKVIQMAIRRPLYSRFKNVATFSSRSDKTAQLYSDIFEQVRSQIMDPLEENLIILYPEKNYDDDTEGE
jgi:hypothetical protein